jgi:hypothetical protein
MELKIVKDERYIGEAESSIMQFKVMQLQASA